MTEAHSHPIFARVYARVSPKMEKSGLAEYREQLLAGLRGRVMEVGAGNGLNFGHYPPQVTGVVAVEPEPHLRELAGSAPRTAVAVEVVDGVAERLPAEDASFDGVVASLMLCSVPDVPVALGEMFRVLKPGGELRFLEHVEADTPGLRRVQHLADATLWPFLFGGCHVSRDTAGAIERAGFEIDTIERFEFPDLPIAMPASPHIVGRAHRPG
jgi:ubiquinone/menaquinone biosynthesis C-methylase UbiE